MSRFLRQSKDGGVSECRSPEDKVGLGRCHHILGDVNPPSIKYNKNDKAHYVDVGDSRPDREKTKEDKKEINKFLGELNKVPVSEERAMEIIGKIK